MPPLLFGLTVLGILAAPGPSNSLLVTAGANLGLRRASVFVLAESMGYMCAVLTLHFAVAPLTSSSTTVEALMRVLVGAYLFWLGWKLWNRRATETTPIVSLKQVFFVTLLNPKALVFALAIIPFGVRDTPHYLLGFSLMTMLTGMAWTSAGATLRSAAHSTNFMRLLPRCAAIVLAAFAVFLVVLPLML